MHFDFAPTIGKVSMAVLGLMAMQASSAIATVEPGRSVAFAVGAVVVDVCQVSSAYRAFVKTPSVRHNPLCTRTATSASPDPITTVSRAGDGTIIALDIEF